MFRTPVLVSLLLASGNVLAQTASTTPGPGPKSVIGRRIDEPLPSLLGLLPDPDLALAKNVPISYPEVAQQTSTQGYVVVKITVNENGDVESVENVFGNPELVGAVADAMKQWKFHPIIKDGTATKVSTKVGVRFAIADGKCTNGVKQATVATPFERKVTVAQEEMQKSICKKVAAVRSNMADLARVEGDVVMAAAIGKDGTMRNLHILSSASPLLNKSALDAVKQWRYRPYVVSGEPVEVETTIKVTFP